ncbi:MAG: hypothetical protein JW768_11385 [Chitinispirillaceae bacterium]|nr:hypothetical protein [Chitinispirillaceae bacterium]
MRVITLSSMMAMVMVLCFSPQNASAAGQYVQITESFVNVYEYLDPKSKVIKMAAKGDRLELIYAGPSWYSVKVGSQNGWVERTAGKVIDRPSIFSPIISIILILIVLAGTIYGVSYYIKKQRTEME